MAGRYQINWSLLLILALLLGAQFQATNAQSTTLEVGDSPVTSRIQISQPDENGIVTITGEANAVFPTARVVIRNLYTNIQVIANASITGSFSAQIFGPGNTPFWISPLATIPEEFRNTEQTVPGGPGTIIYGTDNTPITPSEDTITTIVIDGSLDDWSAYDAVTGGADWRGLTNSDSLYLAVEQNTIDITVANARYTIRITDEQTLSLQQVGPVTGEERIIRTPVRTDADVIELRLPRTLFSQGTSPVLLERLYTLDDETIIDEILIDTTLTDIDERDGILYPEDSLVNADAIPFTIAGSLGDDVWTANGRINTLTTAPGETVTLELDVTLNTTLLPDTFVGELIWQPVTVAGLYTNNGWSNLLTPSGLAVDNVYGDVAIDSVTIPNTQIVQRDGALHALVRFDTTVPDNLPAGRYVPLFRGHAQLDGTMQPWSVAFTEEPTASGERAIPTRLPVVISIGDLAQTRLLWTLFYDQPSDGVRGIIPQEDENRVALSNRVKFDSPTYILPPGTYSVEPSLPSMMPNQFAFSIPPLLPLILPSGRLSGTITNPDGTVTNLPSTPIVQNRLSGSALDERSEFGGQSPIDLYQLTTLNPMFTEQPFEEYGSYQIELMGTSEDIYGNIYGGGGTYNLLIAEPVELLVGALPGTPFAVGDDLFLGGHILPGLPAEVTINIATYDQIGQLADETTFITQANRYGYFTVDEARYTFDDPGEYVIDYDVRYDDPEGRVWAGSLRSAGVITNSESSLIARGQRGVADYVPQDSESFLPIWFTTENYPPDGTVPSRRPYYPYNSGDIARIGDSLAGGVAPAINAQDLSNTYQNWLLGTIPDVVSARGFDIQTSGVIEALPLRPVLGGPQTTYGPALRPDLIANQAYAYISAVRPGLSARQYVVGGDSNALPLYWDSSDPYNQQIGAGADGDEPGDFTFLFGGLVVRNPEADIATTHGYAAFGIVVDADTAPQVYPPYRGADGGPDGGTLVDARGETFDMIFHPTGVRPGQVLTIGDELQIAGHVAPTLESSVTVEIISPGGETTDLQGVTNTYGYLFDPDMRVSADESGIWSVRIVTRGIGMSSAGIPQDPSIEGGVPGTIDRTFNVYVLDELSDPLRWNTDLGDTDLEVRGGNPFNFGITVPADWTDVDADFTVSTLSYVLDSGQPRIGGASVTYQYNPPQLSTTFPNLETDGEGPSGGDVVTLTFAMTGTNDSGRREIRTRTFTLFFDRLLSFEDLTRE